MKVYWNTDNLPKFKQSTITIGSYDGVHLGHRRILETIVERSRASGSKSICISFHPHPRHFFNPDSPLRLLTSIHEKIKLLGEIGIDYFVIVPFDLSFSDMSAEAYIKDFLVKRFDPKEIIIGYDHHFGKDREGDTKMLQRCSNELDYSVVQITQQMVDEIGISSTEIRKAVTDNNFVLANQLLGYPYLLSGKVIYGKQIGRELGYPTANLEIDSKQKLIPSEGVYAVKIRIQAEEELNGMMYIGRRPTLDENQKRSIEVNIFDFDQDIYHRNIEIGIIDYIREDIRFESLDELKEQLRMDEIKCKQRLKH